MQAKLTAMALSFAFVAMTALPAMVLAQDVIPEPEPDRISNMPQRDRLKLSPEERADRYREELALEAGEKGAPGCIGHFAKGL